MVKMTEVKRKAKELALKPGKAKKSELIRMIQRAEGNFPCFETGRGACDQNACAWREECISAPA
jgi:hypothetical protein